MKNPCDECRKNKYCSKICKIARDYQASFVDSLVQYTFFEMLHNKKEKKGR